MKTYHYVIGFLLLLNGCKSDEAKIDSYLKFRGTWTIEQVYANDHWGAPLYWQNTESGKQIRFTSDNKYYEKTNTGFEFVGTFIHISDKQIEITWDKPSNPQSPTRQLAYEFDNEGHLTLTNESQFEGVVGEKYKLTSK